MSRHFPKNSRAIVAKVALAITLLGGFAMAAVTYYGTPKYFRAGYMPVQPIEFSHQLHVGQVGLDCTYCHSHVKESGFSNIPPTQTCLNCHAQTQGGIKWDSGKLAPLREAATTGKPIEWARIHKVPDFVYFNHAAHVNRGVSCLSCHGQINEMPVVWHDQPLSMSWCLDCHRNPEPHLRPNSEVTNLAWNAREAWDPAKDPIFKAKSQEEYAKLVKEHANIAPPVTCYGCHR